MRELKAAVIYSRLLNPAGQRMTIGGIQTYLLHLARLLLSCDLQPTIYQFASEGFRTRLGDVGVVGVPVTSASHRRRVSSLICATTDDGFDPGSDVLIFGTVGLAASSRFRRSISIQHGLACDLPMHHYGKGKGRLRAVIGDKLYQVVRRRRTIKSFQACPNRVCVDYNFLNWYRTFVPSDSSGREWVIPNFARVAPHSAVATRNKGHSMLRILFARRFEQYRGTRIMAEAAKGILENHPNVEFSFAGMGPDEEWLSDFFREERRVKITKYNHEQALEIHLQHDIAVVPSLGSEGTSLSVAEAMGCGCAVVATAVGGITNMIIDGYNGLLCLPRADLLQSRIEEIIRDHATRIRIAEQAYETAKTAFSLERWEASWKDVISQVTKS